MKVSVIALVSPVCKTAFIVFCVLGTVCVAQVFASHGKLLLWFGLSFTQGRAGVPETTNI